MKYLVIGYDSDQQQATFDYVEAADESAAEGLVAEAREGIHDCWWCVVSYTARDLTEAALALAEATKLPRTAAALRKGLK